MSRTARLWAVLAANLALVGALVVVGFAARSLGVWSEAVDYLGDAAGVAVALLAGHLATRPATPSRPRGFPRATAYAALINSGWLLLLSVLVLAAAVDRLVTGVHRVQGLPVLVVSGVAALVMLGGALLLADDVDDADGGAPGDLHVRAVLLDTAADAVAAAGVAVAGVVIAATRGNDWLDPGVALVIAVVIGYHAARLAGRAARSPRR